LAAVARERGALFHTDAVQGIGALPIDVGELGVDMLSLSGHKFYGPKGTGALYVRRGVRLTPMVAGGGQERRLRSGTENVPGLVGLGAAIELATSCIDETRCRLQGLREQLVAGVLRTVPDTSFVGHPVDRLPGNAAFTVRYVEGEAMMMMLDEQGFTVSSGSACASGAQEPSHVLTALGVPGDEAQGSIRVTLGRATSEEDVGRFLEVFPAVVERLREISPLHTDARDEQCTTTS
jgi:cysteine desulfurase